MTSKMQPAEIAEILENEINCVLRKSKINCSNCDTCDLVRPDHDVLTALRVAAEIVRNHDVVHCGECKFYKPKSRKCQIWETKCTGPDDFCSYGERKDGDTNV